MSTPAPPQRVRVKTVRKPQSRTRPWHTYLTIDVLVLVLSRTVFHPFIAWMVPLSLRAVTIPYTYLSMRISIAYAFVLTFLWILSTINERIAFGMAREVDLEEEVIVVTGGAGGLGRLIADFYGMKGGRVAVLDVEVPKEDEGMRGVKFYQCDVGDGRQVTDCATKIRDDLGIPTILINNAAIMNGKSILDLKPEELEQNFRVNVLSHYHIVRAFLPGMLEEDRGTIVTVASVLGHLGCANLSDYTSSKAALLAFHASLKAELSSSQHASALNIKTVLVAPGQLGTPLFADLSTPSNFFAPVVETVDLAKEIVRMVDSGCSGEIYAPFYARWIPVLGGLPVGLQAIVRRWSGMDGAMIELSKKKKNES